MLRTKDHLEHSFFNFSSRSRNVEERRRAQLAKEHELKEYIKCFDCYTHTHPWSIDLQWSHNDRSFSVATPVTSPVPYLLSCLSHLHPPRFQTLSSLRTCPVVLSFQSRLFTPHLLFLIPVFFFLYFPFLSHSPVQYLFLIPLSLSDPSSDPLVVVLRYTCPILGTSLPPTKPNSKPITLTVEILLGLLKFSSLLRSCSTKTPGIPAVFSVSHSCSSGLYSHGPLYVLSSHLSSRLRPPAVLPLHPRHLSQVPPSFSHQRLPCLNPEAIRAFYPVSHYPPSISLCPPEDYMRIQKSLYYKNLLILQRVLFSQVRKRERGKTES